MGFLNQGLGGGSGGGGGAPTDAEYLTLSLNATLTNERRFVPGTNLSAVDGGAGGDYTLNAATGGAPVDATYAVVSLNATLTNERRLQPGTGLTLTDAGAGGDLTYAVAALGITTALVANANITFGKIQDIATDRLLGRDTAGSGSVEEISLDATLEFTGAGAIRRAALTGNVTAPAGSNVTTIPANEITDAMLRDSAAFSVIGKATAGAGDPADIAAADETVLGRTGGGNLGFAQVATGQIANDAITYAKIQNVTDVRLLGRSAGSAGDAQEITVGSGLSLAAGELTASGGGGGAPADATYAVVSLNATLTNERRLQPGTGLTLTDGGAGGDITYSVNLAANFDWTGLHTFDTRYLLENTAGAADEKLWQTQATVSSYRISTRTDLDGAGAIALDIARSGTTVTTVTLGNIGDLTETRIFEFVAGDATANSWPIFNSGTLLTTAEAGAIERDSNCFYLCTDAGNRGYVPIRHFTRAAAAFALQNVNTEQALFAAAQDTLTLETGTYKFEGLIALSGMSATSGNAAIDILGAGTATIGTWLWTSWGRDAAAAASAANVGGTSIITQQSPASIVTASTTDSMFVTVSGTFEVTAAGTLIPSITLVTASAATVRAGTYMMFERIGATGVTSVGQWS